ncbi:hypothetical protein ACJX0J_033147 [Zea mays]
MARRYFNAVTNIIWSATFKKKGAHSKFAHEIFVFIYRHISFLYTLLNTSYIPMIKNFTCSVNNKFQVEYQNFKLQFGVPLAASICKNLHVGNDFYEVDN